MPCFLFTYHGYGTWFPDRAEGYVKRKHGQQVPNQSLANSYRTNATQDGVYFNEPAMRVIIDAVLEACEQQDCRCHFIATEPTHVHLLVSWKHDRRWDLVGRQLRTKITRDLNSFIKKQNWFSKSGSRNRVKDETHFFYLVNHYLPKHQGIKWIENSKTGDA